MSEVKVEKAKPKGVEFTPEIPVGDFFAPTFPAGRFFGLSPFAMIREFGDEMDRMFKEKTPVANMWTPAVDIRRCNGYLVVTAELPGLTKGDVKVEMTDTTLVIHGERKREHEEGHEGFHRYERSYGKFYRAVPLPENARTNEAKAELNNGVLKVSMPVAEAKKNIREVPVLDAADKKPAAA